MLNENFGLTKEEKEAMKLELENELFKLEGKGFDYFISKGCSGEEAYELFLYISSILLEGYTDYVDDLNNRCRLAYRFKNHTACITNEET